MATIEHNKELWNDQFDWSSSGETWSEIWGNSTAQWRFTIAPRIADFLPTKTVLEIAPGFGRWSHFLRSSCDRLIAVDLAAKCIEACKTRFAGDPAATFHVNDGKSLEMIDDGSVDFVFSFDSLVHAEADVLEAYLAQLAAKLVPGGAGFIHHSNLGEFADLRAAQPELDASGRAPSMTADAFVCFAEAGGLCTISQEIVGWGQAEFTDCMSVVVPRDSPLARETRVVRNPRLMNEAIYVNSLRTLYSRAPTPAIKRQS